MNYPCQGTAFTGAPLVHAPGRFVGYAEAVKRAVALPVIAAGRIEPDLAAQDIAEGRHAFLAMARKLLADPEIPIKLVANRPQDIRPCICCHVCVSQIFINERVKCAVNTQTGHELEAPVTPAADHAAPEHRRAPSSSWPSARCSRPAGCYGHRQPAGPATALQAVDATGQARGDLRRWPGGPGTGRVPAGG